MTALLWVLLLCITAPAGALEAVNVHAAGLRYFVADRTNGILAVDANGSVLIDAEVAAVDSVDDITSTIFPNGSLILGVRDFTTARVATVHGNTLDMLSDTESAVPEDFRFTGVSMSSNYFVVALSPGPPMLEVWTLSESGTIIADARQISVGRGMMNVRMDLERPIAYMSTHFSLLQPIGVFGISVVDLASPEPTVLSQFGLTSTLSLSSYSPQSAPNFGVRLAVSKDRLAASSLDIVVLYDITTPSDPSWLRIVSSDDLGFCPRDVTISGSVLYVMGPASLNEPMGTYFVRAIDLASLKMSEAKIQVASDGARMDAMAATGGTVALAGTKGLVIVLPDELSAFSSFDVELPIPSAFQQSLRGAGINTELIVLGVVIILLTIVLAVAGVCVCRRCRKEGSPVSTEADDD